MIYNADGGVLAFADAGATIIAGNTPSDDNCDGNALTSVGYNLTDDTTGTACGFTQPTDVAGADPELGPLAANGGPTETMRSAPGGPAADVIPASPPTMLNGVTVCGGGATDQRGVPRPTDEANCAIGAVEAAAEMAPNITSANATTFTEESAGSFQVTATGVPAPTLTEQGALPAGVTVSTAGLLAGTPAAGTAGSYPVTLTATNGVTPDATQAFTLTVDEAPHHHLPLAPQPVRWDCLDRLRLPLGAPTSGARRRPSSWRATNASARAGLRTQRAAARYSVMGGSPITRHHPPGDVDGGTINGGTINCALLRRRCITMCDTLVPWHKRFQYGWTMRCGEPSGCSRLPV